MKAGASVEACPPQPADAHSRTIVSLANPVPGSMAMRAQYVGDAFAKPDPSGLPLDRYLQLVPKKRNFVGRIG